MYIIMYLIKNVAVWTSDRTKRQRKSIKQNQTCFREHHNRIPGRTCMNTVCFTEELSHCHSLTRFLSREKMDQSVKIMRQHLQFNPHHRKQ